MTYEVATFYKFVPLGDGAVRLRADLLDLCQQQQLCGTILLAPEGINGTLAGQADRLGRALDQLKQDPRFADLQPRCSTAETAPFDRLKVKLKSEIVSFGQPDLSPNQVGTYVSPTAWNQLITDPEVLVVDTRNQYEVSIGSFAGAINPKTDRFRDFPAYVEQALDPAQHRKIAMFCTGGIRCEKASAYLRQQGFEQVYHLQGGILNYLESIPAEQSLWQGECFVFDGRVAVGNGLAPGSHGMCQACGHPVSILDQANPRYVPGQSCPHCWVAPGN
ncbi:MAG: rhodanese-related sulfurtransferase [Synechococcales cyanobacterium RM1_1_8]|nr:rhodanese-related sulfurtransferase [Synechococcales cyanobacterium RM1_1_8]